MSLRTSRQLRLPKLFTTPGFTESSAKAAIEIAERKILSLQRFIKRLVEREIFVPILDQAGLDPIEAGVRLNWGIPEKPDIEIEDLLGAAELGLIRTDEFRNIMKGIGWELREPEQNEHVLDWSGETPKMRNRESAKLDVKSLRS